MKNSKKAIFASAYPEKPMRHFVFKNVSFVVENAGSIQYAADWEMTGATLNGGPFRVTATDSTNMRLP